MSDIPPTDVRSPAPRDPTGVRVPILLSAIFNILAAMAWAAGCVTIFVGIPLVVLCIFEFIQYRKLGEPAQRAHAVGSTRVIAILEICTIVVGNVPSMVCGIVALVNLKDLEAGV